MKSDQNPENRSNEQIAIAADYLGYDNNTARWSPELLAKKRAMLQKHAEFLRALSDESRMDIFIFLMHSGGKNGQLPAYTVSEIADRFNISMSTISHHLQELKRIGIVKVERNGKERYYQLDLDYMIERVGVWLKRLVIKREMLKRGISNCPDDISQEALKEVLLSSSFDAIFNPQ